MKLSYTRSIIDAIHAGTLAEAPDEPDPVFGIHVVRKCPNVPDEMLVPQNTWADKASFEKTARKLADLFRKNFAAYESGATKEVRAAGPK